MFLLLVGVTALCWAVAPAHASASVRTPAAVTRVAEAPRTADAPAVSPHQVAPEITIATTTVSADGATRDDPAADRLRKITYALVGLGVLVLVLNVIFWRLTRPAPVAAAPAAARGAGPRPTDATAEPGTTRISAAAFLATPPGSPLPGASVAGAAIGGAAVAGAAISGTAISGTATGVDADVAPPVGEPAIDAPAPLADIPLGAPKPLVGNDSAWIIEPDTESGLAPSTPTAGDFPEAGPVTVDLTDPTSPAPAAAESSAAVPVGTSAAGEISAIEVSGVEVSGVELSGAATPLVDASTAGGSTSAGVAAPAPSPATHSLIAALSAIPDKEPTVVRFDDPPVERVRPRRAPSGAPGFDRIAKETTASQPAVAPAPDAPEAPRPTATPAVDDMALMASALSSLPPRRDTPADLPDDPALPPVGEFYDQDLDPGDPPGRA